MQANTARFTVAAVVFLISACGGSGGSPSSDGLNGDGTVGANSGFLIGPRVAELAYGTGSTSANGEFSGSSGTLLNFKLGALDLSSTHARSRLSLYDVVGSADQYRFDKAVRVGRLLISLDSDQDARNGVQLMSTAASEGDLDWQYSDSLWQAAAESLVYRLSGGSQSLIDAQQAIGIMATELRSEGENCSAELASTTGFAVADPRCSDRARMALWRDHLSPAMQQIQVGVEGLLNQQQTVGEWWASNTSAWQSLMSQEAEASAWIAYVLAGTDVPLRQAVEAALVDGAALSTELHNEMDRWLDGVGRVMRARDAQERELSMKVLQTWLSYGFDQQALRTALALANDGDWQDLIRAVASLEGIAITPLRLAVVDQQVYLGLQLIDSMMEQRATWVTGGSVSDGGGSGTGTGGQDDTPARVWRVGYEGLVSGTAVEFTVEGSGLGADVSLILAGCSNIQNLSGSSSARLFSCDLSGVAGGRVLQVIDGSDGSLLYEAVVRVTGGSGGGAVDPVVSGVSPIKAERSSSQVFVVSGQNFPLDMRFSLAGCPSAEVQSRSSTQLEVLCQLDDRATVRAGRIESAGGELLYQFNISPVTINEPVMRVVEVEPAAALESETLEMTVSGSGFGAAAQVESDACESISLLSRTDSEITISCRNAQLGTWPVYVTSSQQTVLAPQSVQVRALEAVVTGVSPLRAVEGEWVNLEVSGQFLSSGLQLELSACPEIEVLDGTAVLRQFACTPATAGLYEGTVVAAGAVLYRFDFTVEAAAGVEVAGVSPTSSAYGEPLELIFSGVNLPELAQVEMDACFNMALLRASSTELLFTCTPQQVGSLSGTLVGPDGANLLSFSVTIVDESDPLDEVVLDNVEPATAYIDSATTFTVRGEELPTSLVLSVQGCTAVESLGGDDRQRQFRCTPRGTSGIRQLRVYATDGGALLGTFELQVTGNELRVSDVSPVRTAIGVDTYFRVSGQNLSNTLALDLEGCDARAISSSSTELRGFRCAPYGLAGTRTVRVRDRVGGVLLYSQSIEVLPPT